MKSHLDNLAPKVLESDRKKKFFKLFIIARNNKVVIGRHNALVDNKAIQSFNFIRSQKNSYLIALDVKRQVLTSSKGKQVCEAFSSQPADKT